MKVKIGTQIEEQIYQDLKVVAAREKVPISELIQSAVAAYLSRQARKDERRSGLQRFLDAPPMRISDEDLQVILEADYYEQ